MEIVLLKDGVPPRACRPQTGNKKKCTPTCATQDSRPLVRPSEGSRERNSPGCRGLGRSPQSEGRSTPGCGGSRGQRLPGISMLIFIYASQKYTKALKTHRNLLEKIQNGLKSNEGAFQIRFKPVVMLALSWLKPHLFTFAFFLKTRFSD